MEVVVSGLGALHPFGRGMPTLWEGLLGRRPGATPIRRFDVRACATRFACQLPEPVRRTLPVPEAPDAVRYAAAAVGDALADARLRPREGGGRLGVYFGFENVIGSFEPLSRSLAQGLREGRVEAAALQRAWDERRAPHLDSLLQERFLHDVLEELGPLESLQVICAACASGAEAIGAARRAIRAGRVDAAVAGAADAKVHPVLLGVMAALGMTSRRNDEPHTASRPFERSRDGLVVGEGAAALVLESAEHASRRGARVRARVTGFASSCDAWRLTDPAEDGEAAAEAIRGALGDAGTDAVDYVNAHGTSTPMNDRAEVTALRRVFREAIPPLSSTKGATGHLMAAAGALEAAVCVEALERQVIPPTLHYRDRDPRCDVDVTPNRARATRLRKVLSNSFGIGGQNACLVLEHAAC